MLAYSRTFEIKELSVPVGRAPELKKFYRIIASDERNTAILKPVQAIEELSATAPPALPPCCGWHHPT